MYILEKKQNTKDSAITHSTEYYEKHTVCYVCASLSPALFTIKQRSTHESNGFNPQHVVSLKGLPISMPRWICRYSLGECHQYTYHWTCACISFRRCFKLAFFILTPLGSLKHGFCTHNESLVHPVANEWTVIRQWNYYSSAWFHDLRTNAARCERRRTAPMVDTLFVKSTH